MIEELRTKREAILNSLEDTINSAITEDRDLNDAEDANVTALRAEADKLSARIDQLVDIQTRKAADAELGARIVTESKVSRVSEPELYREDGEFDFVSDVLAASVGGSFEARDRLYAHNEENRATVSGDLGGFVIPEYATSLFAADITEGRPFADIVTKRALTKAQVIIPRQTDRTAVGSQNGENTAFSNGDFKADDDLVVNAKTIAGYTDISVQSLDFGSIDTGLVVSDLLKQYNETLDFQVVQGLGTGGTLLGVTKTPGISDVDGSGVTDEKGVWNAVGQAKVEVQKDLKAGATHLVVTPELFGFLESAIDTEGRPIFGFNYSSPTNVVGTGRTFHGLTVVIDSNVPNTLSHATPTGQTALVVKANELLLWEQGPKTLVVDQVGAHTGTVRLVIRGYAAFTAERRPGASVLIENLPPLSIV